ncbi:MAG: DUF1800 domain-containing protein [Acidobacteriota bacterium]
MDMNPSLAPIAEAAQDATTTGGPPLNRRAFLAWAGALTAAAGAPRAASAQGGTTLTARQAASRLLAQATFGGDLALIDQVVSQGDEAWLDAQLALPVQPMLPEVLALHDSGASGEELEYLYFDWIWWQRAMTAPDVLRMRVAFALSQIFVISRREDTLFDYSTAPAAFHDALLRGALGSFKDLLREVTLSPSMGLYLSHLNNRRSDPVANRFPDENYAREVMQLFTIGLFELNPDGTRKLDSAGQPIPTYGNAEITEMAKIFTGLTMAPEPGEPVEFGVEQETFGVPMVMVDAEHEPGPKTLLGGFVVPAGQTGLQDIESALDHLVQHPNTGPFIGTHLIKFLVTSNPSPAYVARVSAIFADNGAGVRGDMGAVVKAILLDPEARDASKIDDPAFGKVREPFVRWVQLGRAFHATSDSGLFRHFGGDEDLEFMQQYPFFSPSVFNFFSPFHQPAGALTQAGLVAPELEIIHAFTSIATVNRLSDAIVEGEYLFDRFDDPIYLDLDGELEILEEQGPGALVDHLDLLLTYGTMSAETRQTVMDAILPIGEEPWDQLHLALFLVAISPEYAVLR